LVKTNWVIKTTAASVGFDCWPSLYPW